MYYDGLEFHNVTEMNRFQNMEGLRIQRIPEGVRLALNKMAQKRAYNPASVEIRFLSGSRKAYITLSCPEGACEIIPFWGNFQGKEKIVLKNEIKKIELSYPTELLRLDPCKYSSGSFSPRTWRLLIRGDMLHYIGVEGVGLKPPEKDDLPKLRYLTYGTSITQEIAATGIHLSYAGQTAQRLGADLINLGFRGSAFCEREIADYIADRKDWDIASLELSVNMLEAGYHVNVFEERVSYMIKKIAGSNPDKLIFCITILPYYNDNDYCVGAVNNELVRLYRQTLREIVKDNSLSNVYIIEGGDLLKDFDGLSTDLIHPADNGMIQIGENLARYIRAVLQKVM